MKVSELIEKLQELQTECGDLPLTTDYPYYGREGLIDFEEEKVSYLTFKVLNKEGRYFSYSENPSNPYLHIVLET